MGKQTELVRREYKDQVWYDPIWYKQTMGLTHGKTQKQDLLGDRENGEGRSPAEKDSPFIECPVWDGSSDSCEIIQDRSEGTRSFIQS